MLQWELVCNNRWKGALAQSVYMSGLLIGSVLLGNQADRFGRKPVFFAAAVLQLVVGVVVAFVPDFYSFLLLRFLYGVGTVGTLSSSFVLSEWTARHTIRVPRPVTPSSHAIDPPHN